MKCKTKPQPQNTETIPDVISKDIEIGVQKHVENPSKHQKPPRTDA